MISIILILTVLNALNYLYFIKKKKYELWADFTILILATDLAYMFYTGGNQGSGAVWSITFPFLAFYLKSYKVAVKYNIIFFLILFLIFISSLFGLAPKYMPLNFMIILFLIFFCAYCFMFVMEKHRFSIEENLRRANNIFNYSKDLLCIGDINGYFTYLSPSFSNKLGWDYSELKSKPYLEFIHPDDLNLCLNETELLLSGTPDRIVENRFRCKNGEYIWLSWKSVFDPARNEVYMVARDITKEKVLTRNLEIKSEFKRLLVNLSSEIINIRPEDTETWLRKLVKMIGEFLEVDRCYVILFSELHKFSDFIEWYRDGVLPSENFYKDFSFDDYPSLKEFAKSFEILYIPDINKFEDENSWFKDEFIKEEIKSTLLLPISGKDGIKGVFVIDTVNDYKELDEGIIELLKLVSHIISEVIEKKKIDLLLREKTIEMLQVSQTKDKLFSIIAHDLRSPFNSFIGFTDLMCDEERKMTLDEMRGYSKMLNQLAQSSFELLENLLEWSRLQREMIKIETETVIIYDLVRDAISSYSDKVNLNNQLIRLLISEDLIVVVDKRVVGTIIRNLFSNAVKFTPQGGIITIQARKMPDKNLRISIADTGIGIPANILPEIFSFNEEKGRPGLKGEKSSGLGLMLCKEFVELHNGKIWVQSKEYIGTTFTFEIPQC
jgi:PAS domain S-box-containing protein